MFSPTTIFNKSFFTTSCLYPFNIYRLPFQTYPDFFQISYPGTYPTSSNSI